MAATVHELLNQIKLHLNVHPEIQQNACFSGLFLPSQQRQVDQVESSLINSVNME
jgi:hypothetical protein